MVKLWLEPHGIIKQAILQTTLIETGRSKSWQYPNFLRLIISIMLSVPIYTIFLNLADEKKWPTIIFKAIINFIIGVPILLIIYFFIAFWLLVFGV